MARIELTEEAVDVQTFVNHLCEKAGHVKQVAVLLQTPKVAETQVALKPPTSYHFSRFVIVIVVTGAKILLRRACSRCGYHV